jgi:hypothetical protein
MGHASLPSLHHATAVVSVPEHFDIVKIRLGGVNGVEWSMPISEALDLENQLQRAVEKISQRNATKILKRTP